MFPSTTKHPALTKAHRRFIMGTLARCRSCVGSAAPVIHTKVYIHILLDCGMHLPEAASRRRCIATGIATYFSSLCIFILFSLHFNALVVHHLCILVYIHIIPYIDLEHENLALMTYET